MVSVSEHTQNRRTEVAKIYISYHNYTNIFGEIKIWHLSESEFSLTTVNPPFRMLNFYSPPAKPLSNFTLNLDLSFFYLAFIRRKKRIYRERKIHRPYFFAQTSSLCILPRMHKRIKRHLGLFSSTLECDLQP